MTIHLRQLKEENWETYKSVRLKALQTDPQVFGSSFEKDSALPESEWRDRLRNPDCGVYIVFDNETPIGMTGIIIDKNDAGKKKARLWGSWLEPDYRRRGLSDLMYKVRIEWAKNHSTCEAIIVSHRASNAASKNANQKHGFVFTHAEEKTWPDGGKENEIFYILPVKLRPQIINP